MTPSQIDNLFALRSAGQHLVEAIKDTKHLQKNLNLLARSGSPAVVAEYDAIRGELATVLRDLEIVRAQGEDSAAVLSLDELKIDMKQNDKARLRRLDEMVRGNKISAHVATSLINDSSYAYDVTKDLVKTGERLFSSADAGIRSAERSLALDFDEVESLLDESEADIEEIR